MLQPETGSTCLRRGFPLRSHCGGQVGRQANAKPSLPIHSSPAPNTLKDLENKRKALYKKIEEMEDFRRGTISVNYRKCGKGNCICTQPGHPGHGPQYLWSTTIKGKSYAKNLKLGPELQKYMDEIANHRSFLKVCEELVQVSEDICDKRPVPEVADRNELEALKKKLQRIFRRKYKKRLTT